MILKALTCSRPVPRSHPDPEEEKQTGQAEAGRRRGLQEPLLTPACALPPAAEGRVT